MWTVDCRNSSCRTYLIHNNRYIIDFYHFPHVSYTFAEAEQWKPCYSN